MSEGDVSAVVLNIGVVVADCGLRALNGGVPAIVVQDAFFDHEAMNRTGKDALDMPDAGV